MISSIVARSTFSAGYKLQQVRTIVSGPPRVRIPLGEKIAHGIAISIGILVVPMYIAVNIKNYRKA